MAYQAVFQRYELKYILTRCQQNQILQAIMPYMAPDPHGHATIRNIYFDTDRYQLIRRSLERPVYKEKLRLRSYQQATDRAPVFVELKKKFRGVVYKRRLAMPEAQAMDWICRGGPYPDSQIGREIDYFRSFYSTLHPTVFLSYRREAFHCRDGSDFRLTFDEDILCRQEFLSLEAPVWGTALLQEDLVLMELKTTGGIPLWMSQLLSAERIYKTSFSKYGTAYEKRIFPQLKGDTLHA